MNDTFQPVGKPAAKVVNRLRCIDGGKAVRQVQDDGHTMRMFRDSVASLDRDLENMKLIQTTQAVITRHLAKLAILSSPEAAYQWLSDELAKLREQKV